MTPTVISACAAVAMPREAATTAATMLFFIAVSFSSPYPVVTMIERSFVRIKSGLVHVAACGAGRPVLLLHQTPRSWDEYREALPAGTDSIEAWAEAAHDVLAALGHARAVVAGHHTGAAIAVEMAASRPERVEA